MKKVRKSLALDIIDCKEPRPIRRQHSRPSAKPNRKVKSVTVPFNLVLQWEVDLKMGSFVVVSQADRSLSSSFNSSYTVKKEENVLDQGFILGPNEIGPAMKQAQLNPNPVPPPPVSHTRFTLDLCPDAIVRTIIQQKIEQLMRYVMQISSS